LIPFLPPPRLRLHVGLLGIGDLLESAEREELGAELASDEEEVVAPKQLELDLWRKRGVSVMSKDDEQERRTQ
jgi:hypothetical protein